MVFRHFYKSKKGSALIWALVVLLILTMLLATGLMISSQSLTRATDAHVEDQAYYTAFSISRHIAEWVTGDTSAGVPSGVSNPYNLINAMNADPVNAGQRFEFSEESLGDGMGSARTWIRYANPERTRIDISTTATFQDATSTVTATVNTPREPLAGATADSVPVQYIIPKNGIYKLEVWGAQGGNTRAGTPAGSAGQQGGRGGYASGEIYLTAGTVLWLYPGGAGQTSVPGTTTPGGANGGGSVGATAGEAAGSASSGGGASDIRIATDGYMGTSGVDPWTDPLAPGLSNRIIVAGGGGGASGSGSNSYGEGAIGGGLNGGGQAARGGTQTAGGVGTAPGSFGLGGNAPVPDNANATKAGGGGGGWYGGAAGTSGANTTAGGGGSGYVLTATALIPTGYFAGYQNYYLSNTQLLSGSNQIPAPAGGSQTVGRVGPGYVRITQLDDTEYDMPPTNITPNIGPTTGGQKVIVSGEGFTQPGNSIPAGGNTGIYEYAATDDLLVWLDALNKDGLGDGERSDNPADANKWKNLVPGGVDFNLTNVADNFRSLTLNGTSTIVSAANLDFTGYTSLTVEITFKPENTNHVGMLFESGGSAGWNNNIGGFGAVYNTTSSGNLDGSGIVHTNYRAANAQASLSTNYAWNNESTYQTHTNVYTIVADPDGRQVYIDGEKKALIPGGASSGTKSGETPGGGTFGTGLPFYIGSRGGASFRVQGEIASVRIYGKKLTQAEVTQNAETDDFRFIRPPQVTLGGAQCTNVVVHNDSTITCVTPPHAAGLVDNTVSILNELRLTSKNAYLYVQSVDPEGRYRVDSIVDENTNNATGSTSGGELVTIKGEGFMYPLFGYTLKPYVTNGLVLHWDGVNNTGLGYSAAAHDNNATTWADLSGTGNPGTISGTSPITNHWDWNSFYMGPSPAADAARYINLSAIKRPTGVANLNNTTTEVVYQPPSDSATVINSPFVFGNGTNTFGPRGVNAEDFWVSRNGSNSMAAANTATPAFVAPVGGVIQSRTYFTNITQPAGTDFATGKTVYVMANGEGSRPGSRYTLSSQMTPGILAPTSFRLTYPQTSDGYQRNRYFSVRIYGRALTGLEVAQNREADVDRVLGLVPISVTFDGIAATDVVVLDDKTLTCIIPAHVRGATDVSVNLYGRNYEIPDGFTYIYNTKQQIQYRMGE